MKCVLLKEMEDKNDSKIFVPMTVFLVGPSAMRTTRSEGSGCGENKLR